MMKRLWVYLLVFAAGNSFAGQFDNYIQCLKDITDGKFQSPAKIFRSKDPDSVLFLTSDMIYQGQLHRELNASMEAYVGGRKIIPIRERKFVFPKSAHVPQVSVYIVKDEDSRDASYFDLKQIDGLRGVTDRVRTDLKEFYNSFMRGDTSLSDAVVFQVKVREQIDPKVEKEVLRHLEAEVMLAMKVREIKDVPFSQMKEHLKKVEGLMEKLKKSSCMTKINDPKFIENMGAILDLLAESSLSIPSEIVLPNSKAAR